MFIIVLRFAKGECAPFGWVRGRYFGKQVYMHGKWTPFCRIYKFGDNYRLEGEVRGESITKLWGS